MHLCCINVQRWDWFQAKMMPIRCANNVHAEADNGISLEQKKKLFGRVFGQVQSIIPVQQVKHYRTVYTFQKESAFDDYTSPSMFGPSI